MEAVSDLLRQRATQHPDNAELRLALEALDNLIANDNHDTRAVVEILTGLEARDLWGESDVEREITNALISENEAKPMGDKSSSQRFTLVVPPPAGPSHAAAAWRTPDGRPMTLSHELHEELNRTAFLHVLATSPERVVPPGKTLRAALSGAEAQRALRTDSGSDDDARAAVTLQEKVEEIAHRAFWDEVRKTFTLRILLFIACLALVSASLCCRQYYKLSQSPRTRNRDDKQARENLASPAPSQQIARLKRLYADLHTALARSSPLIPLSHPVMTTLAAPLSPTPAPLQSARRHLAAVTTALRERCVLVRDEALDAILADLEEGENDRRKARPGATVNQSGVDASNDLAVRIVNAFRALLRIAELMQADLSSFVLAHVSEDDLSTEIARAARESERSVVLSLCGLSVVRSRWDRWVEETDARISTHAAFYEGRGDSRWLARLVQALGADVPVVCSLPDAGPPPPSISSENESNLLDTTHSSACDDATANTADSALQPTANALPPLFLFTAADLLRLQNRLQALVIAAVLRTLVPLQPKNTTTPTSRESSAEQKPFTMRVLTLLMSEVDEDASDAGMTKLAHLADEVVREHRRVAGAQTPDSSLTSSAPQSSSNSEILATRSQSLQSVSTVSGVDEVALRARVDTLLRASSPVFALLRLRLLQALADALFIASLSAAAAKRKEAERRVPAVMQTGREHKRMRPDPSLRFPSTFISVHASSSAVKEKRLGALRRAIDADFGFSTVEVEPEGTGAVTAALYRLKGYDEPTLKDGVRDALRELANVVDWVRETWGDTLELRSGTIGSS